MLVIKAEQMQAFEQAALLQFEDEMLQHLQQFSPPLVKTLDEAQMRAIIQFGMKQAKNHGFTLRGPVRFYLEMMLLFGSYFDSDPQYPWISELLADQNAGSQMQRADRLYEKTMHYREQVGGPDDAYAIEALRKMALFARQPLTVPADNFVPGLMQEMARIYPQKAQFLGAPALQVLIRKGLEGAQRQRFTSMRGAVLVSLLMLAFGHGCGADPLYPWISRTLTDENLTDPEAKAQRLEKRALTWLDHVIAQFDGRAQA